MIDALGIVNFEDSNVNIKGLSEFRTTPAMSYLGRYRIVDFVISNMVNSGIDHIKVMVRDKPRSLIEHIGSGEQYNINLKHGYVQVLYPDHQAANDVYFHDVFLLHQNIQALEESHAKYVVLAPSYMIHRINYEDVVKYHEESGADITCVYKSVDNANKEYLGCRRIELEDQTIKSIEANIGDKKDAKILTETYIMKRELLREIVLRASDYSPLYSMVEAINAICAHLHVVGYEFTGYLACINSLESYYKCNMEMIDHEYSKQLFSADWPIYTQTNDSPPAFYAKSAHVKNCLIANGCEVYGDLENCILGRGVKIEAGANIKNSLILPKAYVGPYAQIEYAVVDKYARVENKKELIGTEDKLIYIKRRDKV